MAAVQGCSDRRDGAVIELSRLEDVAEHGHRPANPQATAFTHVSLALETLGSQHGCALDAAGKAYCWGTNRSYEVGDGTQGARLVPTAVLDP